MKILNEVFIIALALVASSCSQDESGKYLQLDQSGRAGSLSYTMTRLEYTGTAYPDTNKVKMEIEYNLHSFSDSYLELNGYYSVSFDGSASSVIYYGTFPTSIAPNGNEKVVLEVECFPDWKSVIVQNVHSNNPYSFSLKSSDYPNTLNASETYYPRLKTGSTASYPNNKVAVSIQSLEVTTNGSAYISSDERNMIFQYTLYNRSEEEITFGSLLFTAKATFDSGTLSGGITEVPATNPQSVGAVSESSFSITIRANVAWNYMLFIHKTNGNIVYSFILNHSDFPWIE